jgi:hypothetical protein
MPSPLPGRQPTVLKAAAWLIAMAAIALGMFLGDRVIGPAVSNEPVDRPPLPSAKLERAMIAAMSARPDPSPYRTPTTKFDVPDAPHYGALAKEQALAELGRRTAGTRGAPDDDDRQALDILPAPLREAFGYAPDRAPHPFRPWRFDRHTGVKY